MGTNLNLKTEGEVVTQNREEAGKGGRGREDREPRTYTQN